MKTGTKTTMTTNDSIPILTAGQPPISGAVAAHQVSVALYELKLLGSLRLISAPSDSFPPVSP
jgi:hypothetical protein